MTENRGWIAQTKDNAGEWYEPEGSTPCCCVYASLACCRAWRDAVGGEWRAYNTQTGEAVALKAEP